jgi:hypothetical protein
MSDPTNPAYPRTTQTIEKGRPVASLPQHAHAHPTYSNHWFSSSQPVRAVEEKIAQSNQEPQYDANNFPFPVRPLIRHHGFGPGSSWVQLKAPESEDDTEMFDQEMTHLTLDSKQAIQVPESSFSLATELKDNSVLQGETMDQTMVSFICGSQSIPTPPIIQQQPIVSFGSLLTSSLSKSGHRSMNTVTNKTELPTPIESNPHVQQLGFSTDQVISHKKPGKSKQGVNVESDLSKVFHSQPSLSFEHQNIPLTSSRRFCETGFSPSISKSESAKSSSPGPSRMRKRGKSEIERRLSDSGSNERKRVFRCPFEACGKAFVRQEHLTRHIRTHTGEKVSKKVFVDNPRYS